MLNSLTEIEREIYLLIRRMGEIMTKDIPLKKAGVIPSLVNKGLVVVYKKPISTTSRKKCKFLRCTRQNEES